LPFNNFSANIKLHLTIFSMIKVFGHISPDTDATGSAILWAWYLNTHTGKEATPYVLGTFNKETAFVLNKWGFSEPALLESVKGDDVVIVDTNNPEELPKDLAEANILQIIDHHLLIGGISTKKPIEVCMKPLASTGSTLFSLMNLSVDDLPENIAGLLLSCILSDTLAFRSPTTTPYDKDVAEKLAAKLNIDIERYSHEMFKAKSDVSDFSDIGLLHIDSKKFPVGDKTIRISVVETTDPESILARKDGIMSSIKGVLAEEPGTHNVLFFIVDILKEEATVFCHDEFTKKMIELSFNVTVEGDTEVLPGIVSRKKQILPSLQLPQ
jgi:manganese-dependent inorganic pyrophosphatase